MGRRSWLRRACAGSGRAAALVDRRLPSRSRRTLDQAFGDEHRCTAGRAATRAWNCCSAGHGARSTFSIGAQLSIVKRYASAMVNVSPVRYGCAASVFAMRSKRVASFARCASFVASGVVGYHSGAELLVDFGRDEVEPFHQPVALHRAERRRERAGLAVGDVLQDHRDFGEARAVVELEQRNVAFRVDRVVVGAVGERVLARGRP